jgi:3-dehydroquinate synthase
MSFRTGDERALSRLTVRLGGGRSYPVVVGPGASSEAPDRVPAGAASRLIVVTDSNLEGTHAASVESLLRGRGLATSLVAFPAGEPSKTRATKERIEDAILSLGCGRDTTVLAVGGGVTGDLAGFVAATYMRGIPYLQLPTSLLAMADASIGGKTGVDHPSGKNLIGAIHQPVAVLADTAFLETLPEPEFRGGLAEIVKAGVIGDASLFAELEAAGPALSRCETEAIAGPLVRSIGVKISVVSSDEREEEIRKILNFGHTVGHALERLSGYALAHGEAISVGMVAEARMSRKLGLLRQEEVDRIARLLAAIGLPTRLPSGTTPREILDAAATDKKARRGRLEFVLPAALGEMARGEAGQHGMRIPDEVALEALAELEGRP